MICITCWNTSATTLKSPDSCSNRISTSSGCASLCRVVFDNVEQLGIRTTWFFDIAPTQAFLSRVYISLAKQASLKPGCYFWDSLHTRWSLLLQHFTLITLFVPHCQAQCPRRTKKTTIKAEVLTNQSCFLLVCFQRIIGLFSSQIINTYSEQIPPPQKNPFSSRQLWLILFNNSLTMARCHARSWEKDQKPHLHVRRNLKLKRAEYVKYNQEVQVRFFICIQSYFLALLVKASVSLSFVFMKNRSESFISDLSVENLSLFHNQCNHPLTNVWEQISYLNVAFRWKCSFQVDNPLVSEYGGRNHPQTQIYTVPDIQPHVISCLIWCVTFQLGSQ